MRDKEKQGFEDLPASGCGEHSEVTGAIDSAPMIVDGASERPLADEKRVRLMDAAQLEAALHVPKARGKGSPNKPIAYIPQGKGSPGSRFRMGRELHPPGDEHLPAWTDSVTSPKIIKEQSARAPHLRLADMYLPGLPDDRVYLLGKAQKKVRLVDPLTKLNTTSTAHNALESGSFLRSSATARHTHIINIKDYEHKSAEPRTVTQDSIMQMTAVEYMQQFDFSGCETDFNTCGERWEWGHLVPHALDHHLIDPDNLIVVSGVANTLEKNLTSGLRKAIRDAKASKSHPVITGKWTINIKVDFTDLSSSMGERDNPIKHIAHRVTYTYTFTSATGQVSEPYIIGFNPLQPNKANTSKQEKLHHGVFSDMMRGKPVIDRSQQSIKPHLCPISKIKAEAKGRKAKRTAKEMSGGDNYENVNPRKLPPRSKKPPKSKRKALKKLDYAATLFGHSATKQHRGSMSPSKAAPALAGLKVEETVTDGNCLFDAVAPHVGSSIKELRELTASHMEAHKTSYARFYYDGTHTLLFDDFLTKIRSTNEWACQLTITALESALQRPIIIISNVQNPVFTDDLSLLVKDPIFVLYEQYRGDKLMHHVNGKGHYKRLLVKPGHDGQAILRKIQDTIGAGNTVQYGKVSRMSDCSQERKQESSALVAKPRKIAL